MNDNLPPLPIPDKQGCEDDPMYGILPVDYYTAEQMQAYARAAIERQSVPQPQPVGVFREDDDIGHVELCPHQQAKLQDGDKLFAAAPQPQPVQEPVDYLPIETAPKDASLVRLLVNFDDHSLEDGSEPCWTIGTNALSDTGIDEWLFAGWDWTHDRFTQGNGTPIGWLPMLYTTPQSAPQPLSDDASPIFVLLAVEESIKNGECPWQIEQAFDEYEAQRQSEITKGKT